MRFLDHGMGLPNNKRALYAPETQIGQFLMEYRSCTPIFRSCTPIFEKWSEEGEMTEN